MVDGPTERSAVLHGSDATCVFSCSDDAGRGAAAHRLPCHAPFERAPSSRPSHMVREHPFHGLTFAPALMPVSALTHMPNRIAVRGIGHAWRRKRRRPPSPRP